MEPPQSVIQFIRSGHLFSFSGQISDIDAADRLILTADVQQLEYFASSRVTGEVEADEILEDWVVLKEEEAGKRLFSQEMKNSHVSLDRLMNYVRAYLPLKFHFRLDDVGGDLYHCAQFLEAYGRLDGLYNQIFTAYLAGGFPCGWQGHFPEGKLCVFWDSEGRTPELDETTTLKRQRLQQQILRRKLESES